jgi:hypothetical protein
MGLVLSGCGLGRRVCMLYGCDWVAGWPLRYLHASLGMIASLLLLVAVLVLSEDIGRESQVVMLY